MARVYARPPSGAAPVRRGGPLHEVQALLARLPAWPIALVAVLAIGSAVVMTAGFSTLNGVVKIFWMLNMGIACAALVLYRPVLFPLSAYLFMVPFDTLLQTGSGTITKFLGVAAAGMALLVMTDRRRTITPPIAVLLWALYLAWNIATYMWSEIPFYRSELLVGTIQLFVIYLIFSMLRLRLAEIKILLTSVLLGGVSLAVFGTWLFTHGINVSAGSASQRLALTISKTAAIDADHFAAALVFPIALALCATLYYSGWRKAVYASALVALLCGICVSGTRGSMIAIAVMALYVGIFYGYRRQLAAVAGGAFLLIIPFPSVWARFFDPSQGEAGGRFGIWKIGFDAFKHHWLGGIGAGQFRLAYLESYLHTASGTLVHPWMEDAHNIIAATSVELGVIGLFLLLAAWFYQVRIARCVPRTSSLFHARMAVEAGALGLFINALSLDIMFYKYLWLAFMVGVLVRNAGLVERQTDGVLTEARRVAA